MFKLLYKFIKGGDSIKIWYHPLYLPELYSHNEIRNVSIKYKTILSFLYKNKIIKPAKIKGPRRVSFHKLNLFHRPEYIESTTQSDYDFKSLGLSLNLGEGESLREAQRRVVAGTVRGMIELAFTGLKTAINISGGLHHAEPGKASGFCLYNDVGVAVKSLRKKNYKGKILIIDLDFHQGNGNFEGLKDDEKTYHFSISGSVWRNTNHYKNVKEFVLPNHTGDATYLKTLTDNIYRYVENINPDMICYIAGNDILEDDQYGTFDLTLEGLFKRDKLVYEIAEKRNIPIQIVAGGGYSLNAWKGNALFYAWILKKEHAFKYDYQLSEIDLVYTQYLNKWNPKLKRKNDDLRLDETDLFPELSQNKNVQRLFNYYTRSHIEFQMNRQGVHQKLKEKGHRHVWIEFTERSGQQNMVRLKSKVEGNTHTLIESVVEVVPFHIPALSTPLKLLNVEWLLAQNPIKKFTKDRPKLPGQDYPGLGLADEILAIFVEACERFNLDGVVHCPTHYHVAIKALRHFHYPDPHDEAKLSVIQSSLDGLSLLEASTIMEKGELKDQEGQSVSIEDKKLIYPVSKILHDYFDSEDYYKAVNDKYHELKGRYKLAREQL